MCQWLDEGDGELHTLAGIYNEMVELSKGTECYHRKYLKTKLIEHYKEHIYVIESDGRMTHHRFKHMSSFFMEEFMKKKNQTSNDMIIAAAKIIKSDIREIPKDKIFARNEGLRLRIGMGTQKFANIPWSTFSFQAKSTRYRSVYCSRIQAKIIDCTNNLRNQRRPGQIVCYKLIR